MRMSSTTARASSAARHLGDDMAAGNSSAALTYYALANLGREPAQSSPGSVNEGDAIALSRAQLLPASPAPEASAAVHGAASPLWATRREAIM